MTQQQVLSILILCFFNAISTLTLAQPYNKVIRTSPLNESFGSFYLNGEHHVLYHENIAGFHPVVVKLGADGTTISSGNLSLPYEIKEIVGMTEESDTSVLFYGQYRLICDAFGFDEGVFVVRYSLSGQFGDRLTLSIPQVQNVCVFKMSDESILLSTSNGIYHLNSDLTSATLKYSGYSFRSGTPLDSGKLLLEYNGSHFWIDTTLASPQTVSLSHGGRTYDFTDSTFAISDSVSPEILYIYDKQSLSHLNTVDLSTFVHFTVQASHLQGNAIVATDSGGFSYAILNKALAMVDSGQLYTPTWQGGKRYEITIHNNQIVSVRDARGYQIHVENRPIGQAPAPLYDDINLKSDLDSIWIDTTFTIDTMTYVLKVSSWWSISWKNTSNDTLFNFTLGRYADGPGFCNIGYIHENFNKPLPPGDSLTIRVKGPTTMNTSNSNFGFQNIYWAVQANNNIVKNHKRHSDLISKNLSISPPQRVEADISLYPNPVDDYLYLESEYWKSVNWEVCSPSGSILLNGEMDDMAERKQIDLNELKSGFYFLKLYYKGNLSVHGIVKN